MIANHPQMLGAWTDFAGALRRECTTARGLRELMVLRVAYLSGSSFIWDYHRPLAIASGMAGAKIQDVRRWRRSKRFTPVERSALALADAIVAGHVPDRVARELARRFDAAQRVELTITASFYQMVPRILSAFGLAERTTSPVGRRRPAERRSAAQ